MFDDNVFALCDKHQWMTFEDAWLLMRWSYEKNKDQDRYCGMKTVETLMGIDFGIYIRQTEPWLRGRIIEARRKFGYEY